MACITLRSPRVGARTAVGIRADLPCPAGNPATGIRPSQPRAPSACKIYPVRQGVDPSATVWSEIGLNRDGCRPRMGGMLPLSQIRRTLGGAASTERILDILATEEFMSRGAPGQRICEEFGVADARGRWQLVGCLRALGVLAGRSDRLVLPPPQRPPIPSAPRRRHGHDAQRWGTRHRPQVLRPRENQGHRVVDGVQSRPRPVPPSLRLGCRARSRTRSCPSGGGRQTGVNNRRVRSVHGRGTAWNRREYRAPDFLGQ